MTSFLFVWAPVYTQCQIYEDAPRPTAGEGEVLIRVHATSVNPFDAAVRAGYMAAYF